MFRDFLDIREDVVGCLANKDHTDASKLANMVFLFDELFHVANTEIKSLKRGVGPGDMYVEVLITAKEIQERGIKKIIGNK